MSVLVNFKICDNDKACSGMAVCPMGVFTWNGEKNTLEIDNSKCICCGACEKACMVSAIRVAHNDEEYKKIEKEIEEDPRSINDLLVEKYGAKVIDLAMAGEEWEIDSKLDNASRPLIVELYNEDSIMCLLKSINVKEIADAFSKDTRYRKIEVLNEDLMKRFDITELPSLLFFKDGKFVGKVEGYYTTDEKDKLINQIKDLTK